jgi:beta-xylosidase
VDDWPAKLGSVRCVTDRPVWVTEVGVSTYASEEVQRQVLVRTAELLMGQAERIHWYSLFDLPRDWGATTRHKEREGSSYFRHFHMGLIRPDGTPKAAAEAFARYAPDLGLCQWFHYEDPRLDDAVRWLKRMGVKKVRTGLAWSDDHDRDATAWFDRQMKALEPFDVTVTFCFTPECRGLVAHHTSPPQSVDEFADFCARMVRRYAAG